MNNLDKNYYSKWLDTNELLDTDSISAIGLNDEINKMGLPIGTMEEKIIVDNNVDSTLVIGSIGSGKTQSIILPMLFEAVKAGETLFVNDPKGELYLNTADLFKKNEYKIVNINLENPDVSDSWNPFTLVSKLYNDGKIDDAYKVVNLSLQYLLSEDTKGTDPFWSNTASQYLVGIILSLLEKNIDNSKLNFETLSKFTTDFNSEVVNEYIENLDRNGIAYKNISATYLAPYETKASIMSVLNQKLTELLGRKRIVNRLSTDSFDISKIRENKTIIYFTYDDSSLLEAKLYNMFIEQLIYVINNDKIAKPFTFLLDDFDTNPKKIVNFNNKINNLRSSYGQAVIFIKGFDTLTNVYGKEDTEILKYQVHNILYLISNEYNTLKFISDLCGKKNSEELLVSPEGLRRMPYFTALYLKFRTMPYYGKIMPFYQMDIDIEKSEFINREYAEIDILDLNNI